MTREELEVINAAKEWLKALGTFNVIMKPYVYRLAEAVKALDGPAQSTDKERL